MIDVLSLLSGIFAGAFGIILLIMSLCMFF
jgi:hypothetical protein